MNEQERPQGIYLRAVQDGETAEDVAARQLAAGDAAIEQAWLDIDPEAMEIARRYLATGFLPAGHDPPSPELRARLEEAMTSLDETVQRYNQVMAGGQGAAAGAAPPPTSVPPVTGTVARPSGPSPEETAAGMARRARNTRRFLLATGVSILLGIIFICIGVHVNDTYGNGSGWVVCGVLGIVTPVLGWMTALIGAATVGIIEQERKYSAWKKTLPPEQRMAVSAAELGALMVAQHAFHERQKASHQRHLDTVVTNAVGHPLGQTMAETGRQLRAWQADLAARQSGPAIWQQGPQPKMWQQP